MPRCNFARSVIAVVMPLLMHDRAFAHGLTNKEWAMTVIAYSKVCEELFPEKKAAYSEAIRRFKSTDSRLGTVIEAIEKDQDEMKIVTEFANELAEDRSGAERECRSLEKSPNK